MHIPSKPTHLFFAVKPMPIGKNVNLQDKSNKERKKKTKKKRKKRWTLDHRLCDYLRHAFRPSVFIYNIFPQIFCQIVEPLIVRFIGLVNSLPRRVYPANETRSFWNKSDRVQTSDGVWDAFGRSARLLFSVSSFKWHSFMFLVLFCSNYPNSQKFNSCMTDRPTDQPMDSSRHSISSIREMHITSAK